MTDGSRGAEEQRTDYLAYLLRLWRMQDEGAAGWRASLVSPGDRQKHIFASLDELLLYLRRQTGAGPGGDDDKDRPT